ncbi:MAG: hypothetical protein DRP58_11520 [Spirochaetes bacterium]|nr:MAG: hypothetical protein DRP58_11520 [Spirochaetota bacterium]
MSKFIRLHIIAEGHTEEKFVRGSLAAHLGKFQISTDVRRVMTSRDKRQRKFYRGGLINYEKARNDIQLWLKEDKHPESRFTTMFDLYGLPDNFPAYLEAKAIKDPYQQVKILENALQNDIGDSRFVPYIQLHEFEALVLANPANLEHEYFDHTAAIKSLQKVLADKGGNSELINDGYDTAPSRRIEKVIPEYDKANVGSFIAGVNGINFLKETCRHFSDWVNTLERLSSDL